jgi:hypothetical protein
MRKSILFLAVAVATITTSCDVLQDCTCGIVKDDGIESQGGNSYYWVTIKNDCSGVTKKFYLSQGDWMNAHPSKAYCITDTEWKEASPTTNTKAEMFAFKESMK